MLHDAKIVMYNSSTVATLNKCAREIGQSFFKEASTLSVA